VHLVEKATLVYQEKRVLMEFLDLLDLMEQSDNQV